MRRVVILSLGLLAATLLIWWSVDNGPSLPSSAGTAQGEADPGRVNGAPSGAAAAAQTRLSRSEAKTSGDRGIPLQGWLLLRVVEMESRAVVPDADVFLLTSQEFTRARRMEPESKRYEQERMHRRFGSAMRTDARGFVRFPLTTHATVTARTADLYGYRRLAPVAPGATLEHTLELQRDWSIRARVTSLADTPVANVPVKMSFRPRSGLILARTEDDGIAVLPHLQGHARGRTHGELALHVPGVNVPAVDVELVSPPTGPILFRLPPTVALTASVATATGEPIWTGDMLELTLPEEDGAKAEAWSVGVDRDGHWRFPHVVPGREYRGRVDVGGVQLDETIHVPAAAVSEYRVVLRLPEAQRHVCGRALDEQGAPLAESVLVLSVDGKWQQTRTGSGGRFRVVLPDDARTLALTVSRLDAPTLHASVELQQGQTELGDVVLRAHPLLVAGHCLRDGKPIASAPSLAIEVELPGGFWAALEGGELLRPYGGTFECRAPTPNGPCRLAVNSAVGSVGPYPFTPGTRDLVIELPSIGSLTAEAILDPGLSWGVLLRLQPRDVPPPQDHGPLGSRLEGSPEPLTEGRVRYRWRGLQPGSYDLQAWTWGGTPFREITNVVVAPAPGVADPRLKEIDLRGAVRTVEVRVSDEEGAPLTSGRDGVAVFVDPDRSGPLLGFRSEGGICRFPTTAPNVDLLVTAYGRRPQRVLGAVDTAAVTLLPGPRVVLQLTPHGPVPDGWTLILRLWPVDPSPGRWMKVRGETRSSARRWRVLEVMQLARENGRFVFAAREAGKFRVGAQLGGVDDVIDIPVLSPTEIFVPDAGITDPVFVRIDDDALRAVVGSRE